MKNLIRGCVFNVDVYKPGKNKVALKKECKIEGEICKLASNENPLGPSPLAIKEIKKSLSDGHLYPDASCSALVDKLAKSLGFSPENLAVGNGTTDLIHLIGVAFLNPGEGFIMSQPSFIMAKMVAQVMDCSLVEVSLKNYSHDLVSVLKTINKKTKVIYLDNPINPIGT
ncbi:MAG: aminotransferase class I/II-fold pyridoxal phosphate-dependent enzyme, partial [Candidatus Aminicenantaceae bacterium]